MHTRGFGQVEQKIDQRYKDNLYTYDFTTNLEVGKLLPEKAGIRILQLQSIFASDAYPVGSYDIHTPFFLIRGLAES